MRLLAEFNALFPEIRRDRIDAGNGKAEMIEALIGSDRRRIDAVTGRNLRGEDHATTELDIDTRLSLLRRTDDFGAEHALEPLRRVLRIGRPKMNVVPGKTRHLRFSSDEYRKTRTRCGGPRNSFLGCYQYETCG